MFLKERRWDDLVAIDDLDDLFNPHKLEVPGRRQSGEEEQPQSAIDKHDLLFPSGEELPRCCLDPAYRDEFLHHRKN